MTEAHQDSPARLTPSGPGKALGSASLSSPSEEGQADPARMEAQIATRIIEQWKQSAVDVTINFDTIPQVSLDTLRTLIEAALSESQQRRAELKTEATLYEGIADNWKAEAEQLETKLLAAEHARDEALKEGAETLALWREQDTVLQKIGALMGDEHICDPEDVLTSVIQRLDDAEAAEASLTALEAERDEALRAVR